MCFLKSSSVFAKPWTWSWSQPSFLAAAQMPGVHALAPLGVVGPTETGGFATELLAEPFDSGFALVNLELPVGLNLKTVL